MAGDFLQLFSVLEVFGQLQTSLVDLAKFIFQAKIQTWRAASFARRWRFTVACSWCVVATTRWGIKCIQGSSSLFLFRRTFFEAINHFFHTNFWQIVTQLLFDIFEWMFCVVGNFRWKNWNFHAKKRVFYSELTNHNLGHRCQKCSASKILRILSSDFAKSVSFFACVTQNVAFARTLRDFWLVYSQLTKRVFAELLVVSEPPKQGLKSLVSLWKCKFSRLAFTLFSLEGGGQDSYPGVCNVLIQGCAGFLSRVCSGLIQSCAGFLSGCAGLFLWRVVLLRQVYVECGHHANTK